MADLFGRIVGRGKKKNPLPDRSEFPSERYVPILRCSICNGEQVAGFREKETGHFTEIMAVRSEGDLALFREQYGVKELRKEY